MFDPKSQAELAAATKAILNEALGPSDDPDFMLSLFDLVPDEWIGGDENRMDVAERLAGNLAVAAWQAIKAAPPERDSEND